jgi:hypothetical protein
MNDDTTPPTRRVPLDMPIITPKMRNKLAAERAERLRIAIEDACCVLPKREVYQLLDAHMARLVRAPSERHLSDPASRVERKIGA